MYRYMHTLTHTRTWSKRVILYLTRNGYRYTHRTQKFTVKGIEEATLSSVLGFLIILKNSVTEDFSLSKASP